MDLSASLDLLGQLDHPNVVEVTDTIAEKVRGTDLMFGLSCGYLGEAVAGWLGKGVQWLSYSTDVEMLCRNGRGSLGEIKEVYNDVRKL